jgi:hypothetical protein
MVLTYHFKDFVNFVKLEYWLMGSQDFVKAMYEQGRKEKVLSFEGATKLYDKHYAIWKDKELVQYLCRVYYIEKYLTTL